MESSGGILGDPWPKTTSRAFLPQRTTIARPVACQRLPHSLASDSLAPSGVRVPGTAKSAGLPRERFGKDGENSETGAHSREGRGIIREMGGRVPARKMSNETAALLLAFLCAPGFLCFAAPEIVKPDCRTVNAYHPAWARSLLSSAALRLCVRFSATAGR
jgi:hypothetical protein